MSISRLHNKTNDLEASKKRTYFTLLTCLLLFLPLTSFAQTPTSTHPNNLHNPHDEHPLLTPTDRIAEAKKAFARADYPRLFNLLEPLATNPETPLTLEQLKTLLPWYAAGLVVKAQQEPLPKQRQAYYERARRAFLRLLELDPDYQLEELLYPEQVLLLFNSIVVTLERGENSAVSTKNSSNNPAEPVYIQKEITKHQFLLVFLPFGIGQFQNGHQIAATLAASIQVAALITNITSFIVMEHLRLPTGFYRAEDFRTAKAWRTTMYASLATFLATYTASVIDAWIRFKDFDINIRVLDGPPDDLTQEKSVANFTRWQQLHANNRHLPTHQEEIYPPEQPINFSLNLSLEAYW